MSPLRLEILGPTGDQWFRVGEVKPGDRPGSVSQNLPDGGREVYVFSPDPDDSKSTISKSVGGVDPANPARRTVFTEQLETVATLKDGESYTLSLKSDTSPERRIVRFTHLSENLG